MLRLLQGALLSVFALPADLLAALELQPQFSNLLGDITTHKERFKGRVGVSHFKLALVFVLAAERETVTEKKM